MGEREQSASLVSKFSEFLIALIDVLQDSKSDHLLLSYFGQVYLYIRISTDISSYPDDYNPMVLVLKMFRSIQKTLNWFEENQLKHCTKNEVFH